MATHRKSHQRRDDLCADGLHKRGLNAHAKFRSCSHDAVIRVSDDAGNEIETHEHKSEFKAW
jgi:hypothetical protein